MKVGIGFDVHPLVEDEDLIIGGVKIKADFGLKGHSDADVLTHALMDAILGALGKGDIGKHFPDTDDVYRGISSMLLLAEVYKLLEQENCHINNVDLILMAQVPKMAPYSEKIVQNYADELNTDLCNVNFKATTTEHLGFVGRKEGIAAQAIVSLAQK